MAQKIPKRPSNPSDGGGSIQGGQTPINKAVPHVPAPKGSPKK